MIYLFDKIVNILEGDGIGFSKALSRVKAAQILDEVKKEDKISTVVEAVDLDGKRININIVYEAVEVIWYPKTGAILLRPKRLEGDQCNPSA